ncbi:hypothetical protein RFN58_15665 [Streptomyces iakyrus]|uniref:hypothetical protein n=1 Tax=Streptomyces iakyrus TaxID=68219 RepID=UPI0012FEB9DB|nr:hypothetical protein [Streptomyces iakyrus]
MSAFRNWINQTDEKLSSLVERLPRVARILLLGAIFLFTWLLFFTSLTGRVGQWGPVVFLSGFIIAKVGRKLVAPHWRASSDTAKRRFSGVAAFLLPLFLLFFAMWQIPDAAQENEAAAGLPLVAVWVIYAFMAGPQEPDDFPLEHLRMRIARAAFFRVATNWCAIIGLIWFISHMMTDEKLRGPVFSASLTLVVGVTVASLKTYSRVRKLCTQIHCAVQSLMRDFEELRTAEEPKEMVKIRATARRTWDGLSRLMSNRIDTGFHRYGIFVLPKDAIGKLEGKVMAAIDADPPTEDVQKPSLEDLRMIQMACERRLDDMA